MSHIELSEDRIARITIDNVGSDLRVRGWDRPAVSTDEESAYLEEREDGTIQISASSDLALRAPRDAELTIERIGSDAKLTEIEGLISIARVGSDLILRKTGPLEVDAVGGDLRIKRANGDVTIGKVGGDLTLREVEGNTRIDTVGGDLYVRDVLGGCVVDRVGGDLVLSTNLLEGAEYRFSVGGDIVCRIPPEADARIRIMSCADLSVDVPDVELIEGDTHDEIILGNGAALVELSAGGDIRLVGQADDVMMAINFQLEEDLAARLSGIEEKLSEQLAGLDDLIASKAERLREKAEKQAERAMRSAERAARRAEQKIDKGKRKRSFTLSFGGGSASRSTRHSRPQPPREPVSDEERLMILRMVEARQISVEEAERLLSALEG